MFLSERIKQIRKTENLTQAKFGEKLGVSRDVISSFESGRINPKPLFINHLCASFNINKDWLLNGTGYMYNSKNNITNLELKESICNIIMKINNIDSLNNIKNLSYLLLNLDK